MFDIFSDFVFRGDLGCAREGIYNEWAQVIVDFSYAATQSTSMQRQQARCRPRRGGQGEGRISFSWHALYLIDIIILAYNYWRGKARVGLKMKKKKKKKKKKTANIAGRAKSMKTIAFSSILGKRRRTHPLLPNAGSEASFHLRNYYNETWESAIKIACSGWVVRRQNQNRESASAKDAQS